MVSQFVCLCQSIEYPFENCLTFKELFQNLTTE